MREWANQHRRVSTEQLFQQIGLSKQGGGVLALLGIALYELVILTPTGRAGVCWRPTASRGKINRPSQPRRWE